MPWRQPNAHNLAIRRLLEVTGIEFIGEVQWVSLAIRDAVRVSGRPTARHYRDSLAQIAKPCSLSR
jgi:hypothetical protein